MTPLDAPADPYEEADTAAGRLAELTGRDRHDAVVVLGSGWAAAAEAFGTPEAAFPMTDVPGFHAPVAAGHSNEIRCYDLDGVSTLVYFGRTHLYEGQGMPAVAHGIRTAAAAGVRLAVITNANGCLRADWEPGTAVLISDHLNLTGTSPLDGPRFVDLADAWSPRLQALARELDPALETGVYAWLRGPHYETWAEAGWLRRVGADMLGMSTVPEAIAAREREVEVLGISTVTAIEGQHSGVDPDEVVEVATATAARLGPALAKLVARGARA